MSYDAEICKLVIENAALVEKAQEILEWVDERLVEQIWKYLSENCSSLKNFEARKDENDDYYLWNSNWPQKGNGMPLGAFWLDGQGENYERQSWLSIFCGLASGSSAGLFFWCDWSFLNCSRKTWKAFLKDFFIKNPALERHGFSLNEKGTAIIKIFNMNLKCLANNFNNFENCFNSLDDALADIYSQTNLFTDLLEKAKSL